MNPDLKERNGTLSKFGAVYINRLPEDISTPEEQIDNPTRSKIMVKQTQTGYTPISKDDNQPDTGTERVIKEGQSNRHRNATGKNTKNGIPITFK